MLTSSTMTATYDCTRGTISIKMQIQIRHVMQCSDATVLLGLSVTDIYPCSWSSIKSWARISTVKALVSEPIGIGVSLVIVTPLAKSAMPYPRDITVSFPLTTATLRPAIWRHSSILSMSLDTSEAKSVWTGTPTRDKSKMTAGCRGEVFHKRQIPRPCLKSVNIPIENAVS